MPHFEFIWLDEDNVSHLAEHDVTPEEAEAAKLAPIEIAQKRFPIDAPHFVL